MAVTHDLADRLLLGKFSSEACVAAIRGLSVPRDLGHPLHQICVIRGIRYHSGFAEELYGLIPAFTRALNARKIMDNKIPATLDDKPYCIWYPVTASEDVYRQLAQEHPDMAYQVGRACAVAGYTTLYRELNLLPDVHIAEEARESGSLEIYNLIMSQKTRYSIMNDYERRIDDPKSAFLNGDTAVRWMLDIKQEFEEAGDYNVKERSTKRFYDSLGFQDLTFNITEDMNIDEYTSEPKHLLTDRLETKLLSEPLPTDLPTVQKDLLILISAYRGDIDRYTRLRRPNMIFGEKLCCIRGIYHDTFFAIWWSKQTPDYELIAAINARMIMNNMLAGAPYKNAPYLIWWPTVACESTYRELAKLQPNMIHQIVHACIFAGYRDLYDELLPRITPDRALVLEAEEQANSHFRDTLETYKPVAEPANDRHWTTQIRTIMRAALPYVGRYLEPSSFGFYWTGAYNGRYCDASTVELAACLPDAWSIPADATEYLYRQLDYKEWPHGAADNTEEDGNADATS